VRVLRQEVVLLSGIREPSDPIRMSIPEEKVREIAGSLLAQGQFVPIQLVEVEGGYEIHDGQCRFLAARMIGMKRLRADVVDLQGDEPFWVRWAVNEKRIEHSPRDKASHAARAIQLCSGDVEAAAMKLGRPKDWVEKWADVESWPEDVKRAVYNEEVSWAAGRWIGRIGDEAERRTALRTAIRDGCSEALARWWYEQWAAKGMIPSAPTGQPGVDGSRALVREPTWVCYYHLDERPSLSMRTVKMCDEACSITAANRPEGVSNDPNIGLLG